MDRMEYWKWLETIKVGDAVRFDWTAGSFGHFSGRVRIVKVNPKSVVGVLLEEIGGPESYPKGHKLRLPKNPMDRKFSEMFNAPAPMGINRITRPKPRRAV